MDDILHEFLPGTPGDARDRIRAMLTIRGINQAELAEKAGISESALSRYMSGQTDKMSVENIVAIAKVLEVSTDFLLCLTNIPYTTNYDLEKLGLSAKAGEILIRRKIDPKVVSQLIENQYFSLLVTQLTKLRDNTFAASYAYMTEMLHSANALLTEYARENPEDRYAAKKVVEDIRLLRAAPHQVQTDTLHNTLDKIVEDFKKGTDAYMEETQKLTSAIMAKIISNLKTQLNHPMKLRGITPEMMVDSIMDVLKDMEITEEQKQQLRSVLLPLFTSPIKLSEKG